MGLYRSHGQSPDSLAKRIDPIFSEWDKTNSPGCALAVLKDGRIIYERGYGMSNLEYNIAITPASRFHVASISKQFAAAAIQRLALEGKLSLDDEVRKTIPEMPDFGHRITFNNLIHHTSGLRDQWDLQRLAGWRDDDLITEQDVLDMLKRQQALNFIPGEEYLYCNTGFTLLAVAVKRITGVSLREYADSVFFRPLGMNNTVFHSDHTEIVVGRTSAYAKDSNRWAISIPVFDTYGATSLFTTVEDLAKWDENFYTAKIGGQAFIDAMLKPGMFTNGMPQNYASGLTLGEYRGKRTVEHAGADAGYRANFLRFPEVHLSVIVLANLADINTARLCRKVADLWLPNPGLIERITIADNAILQKWAGDYLDPVTKARARVEVEPGRLLFNGNVLRTVNDSVFVQSSTGANYSFREEGAKTKLLLQSEGVQNRRYEKVKKVTLSGAGLKEYEGNFYSPELETTYALAVKDSALTVKTPRYEAFDLSPYIRDVFTGQVMLEFVRDKQKRITGFLLSTGRSRNIRFEKEGVRGQ